MVIYTIGHSTREAGEFVDLLRAHGVRRLVDIRTIPRSRRYPHFSIETLPGLLAGAGIEYEHRPSLGGLRKPRKDSVHTGWRNAGFRGYADHMETPEFESGLASLIEAAERAQVAVMCAEAVPWKCHRLLLSDVLTVRGVRVEHIMSEKKRELHRVTPWASVNGTRLLYIK